MIDGFKIEVTADEIARHLEDRIRHHHEVAEQCESKAKRVEVLEPLEEDGEEEVALCWPGYQHELERRAARHRSREVLMIFLRDRLVPHEIYRLSQSDLRSLEWLPLEEAIPSH